MLIGLNHITLTVSNLQRSQSFYADLLGFQRHVTWNRGAYLSLGSLWLCLSVGRPHPAQDYSHVALGVDSAAFPSMQEKLLNAGITQWQPNASEGASLYFLDPDGHQLELHVGDLQSRLKSLRTHPYEGLQWHSDS